MGLWLTFLQFRSQSDSRPRTLNHIAWCQLCLLKKQEAHARACKARARVGYARALRARAQ